MNEMTPRRAGRRALALSALAAVSAAVLGLAAEPAAAAYTAKVKAGILNVTGDGASDTLVLRLQPGDATRLQVDVGGDGTAEYTFDRSTFTAIQVDAGRGDDEVRIDSSTGVFTDEAVTLNGGAGADLLRGGFGAETLVGGGGNDDVDGGPGGDRVLLGDGDDVFRWDAGDASDVVDGQRGSDRLAFQGNGATETIDVSADGGHVRFTRDVASVVTDLDGVERIGFAAAGSSDTVVVHDLAGTDAGTVAIDLHAIGGGGDAQPDSVVVRGTDGADQIDVGSSNGALVVSGLAARVEIAGGEAAYDAAVVAALDGVDTLRYSGTAAADTIAVLANGTAATVSEAAYARVDAVAVESLVVLGLAGADTITATGNLAPLTTLTFDGGDEGDTLLGGNGADLLLGGAGDDLVDGNQGNDQALLGDGDDRFQWDPGDGSDTVEGQAGTDRLDVNGSNIGETIDLSAQSGRVRFTRNIGTVTLDLDDVEGLGFRAFGGADTITVGDLAGTDATTVDVDLNAAIGGGDAQPDTVIVNGSGGPDVVDVTRSGAQVLVAGLAAQTRIAGGEAALDTLRIQTLGGDDQVTVAPDVSELLAPIVDLGADE